MKYAEILAKIAEKAKAQQAIVDKAKTDKRDLSEEDVKSLENLQKEIEGLKKQAEIAQKMEETEKYLGEPATGPVIPITNETQEEKLDNGGFKNVAEFLHCVKNGDSKGRLKSLASSDAGILIPPQFSQSILMLNSEDEIIMPRATNIPAGDPPDAPFVIPYFQQGADGALGGIQLTWTNEAKTVSDTKDPVIKDLTLAPQECSGLATVNNKTLANWQAAGAFIQTLLRQAWISGRDLKFLNGSGSGCPLGIYNAPGALKIKRETASKITYLDIVTMVSRLYGEGLWIINKTIMPTLMTLQDPEGHYIFNGGDATKGIPATLIGLPIKWNGKSPTLGSKGDLTLIDLKYYLTKAGSGPYVAISEHVKFTSNQTVFKIVANIDGQPWVKDPLLLDDGKTTVSPYVILN